MRASTLLVVALLLVPGAAALGGIIPVSTPWLIVASGQTVALPPGTHTFEFVRVMPAGTLVMGDVELRVRDYVQVDAGGRLGAARTTITSPDGRWDLRGVGPNSRVELLDGSILHSASGDLDGRFLLDGSRAHASTFRVGGAAGIVANQLLASIVIVDGGSPRIQDNYMEAGAIFGDGAAAGAQVRGNHLVGSPVLWSGPGTIEDNLVVAGTSGGQTTTQGILVGAGAGTRVVGNIIEGLARPLEVASTVDPVVAWNTIDGAAGRGILVEGATRANVTANTVRDSGREGIYVGNGTGDHLVEANLVEETGAEGIHVVGAVRASVRGNTVLSAGEEGIFLERAAWRVWDNVVLDSARDGIVVELAASDTSVVRNEVRRAGPANARLPGIWMGAGQGLSIVYDNVVSDASDGIYVDDEAAIVEYNLVTRATYGIRAVGNGSVAGNAVSNATFGIFTAGDHLVASNTVTSSTQGITGYGSRSQGNVVVCPSQIGTAGFAGVGYASDGDNATGCLNAFVAQADAAAPVSLTNATATNSSTGIFAVGVGSLTVKDALLRGNNVGFGGSGPATTITGTRFQQTGLYAFDVTQGSVTVRMSSFDAGASARVQSGVSVDARFNWWGHATGPRHASNPGGLGTLIEGSAQLAPWLTSAP